MPTLWITIPHYDRYGTLVLPADQEEVYVRRGYVIPPFKAVWHLTTGTFTPAGLTPIPWYEIHRWRHI